MDNSDHDLFARVYDKLQQVAGFMPIDFIAPLDHGSTRKPKTALPPAATQYLSARIARARNSTSGLELIVAERGLQWVMHDEDRLLTGHLQRCVQHYRSKGELQNLWWRPLPNRTEGE